MSDPARLWEVDAARGTAILTMISFHFVFDSATRSSSLASSFYGPRSEAIAGANIQAAKSTINTLMETLGPCMICGKPGRYSCPICGRLVCDEHFDLASRMCTDDARKVRHRGRTNKGEPGELLR